MRSHLYFVPDSELRCPQCVEGGLKQVGTSFFYCLDPAHVHDEPIGEEDVDFSISDDEDSGSYDRVSSKFCEADGCEKFTKFSCTGCQDMWYCSEKCQYADWKEHKHKCDIAEPFNWSKHGLFTTVEHAIDDMVGDSYEDDDLQAAGELIEQELLDVDEPSPELHERAVNFIEAVQMGPNMYQLIYEHPLGDGDEELLQLVEDHVENLIKEHDHLQEEWHIGANVAHRDQLSQDILDGEALYDEISFHIEQGQPCPDWLRAEGVELIGKRSRRRKKKRKKRKRKNKKKKSTKKRKGKKKKRKSKRKASKKKDKKKRKRKKKKDKKKGLSKSERKSKNKKRKKKDKGKQQDLKTKDRIKNKRKRKKKDQDKNKKRKDKGERKKDRKSRDKKERRDDDGGKRKRKKRDKTKEESRDKKKDKTKSRKDRDDDDGGSSGSSSSTKDKDERVVDDDDEKGEGSSKTFLEKQKEAIQKRRDRAERMRDAREERKERAEERRENLKDAKAATDEAREDLSRAELEQRRALQGDSTSSRIGEIYLY